MLPVSRSNAVLSDIAVLDNTKSLLRFRSLFCLIDALPALPTLARVGVPALDRLAWIEYDGVVLSSL